ncbi:MAG: protein kinase, partial [Candidatus Schekmanbacteria bacterium]|nr:protein kinase [Candidatus Schekmanbacteria bacterium]
MLRIAHPHVVPVLDFLPEVERLGPVLVMPFIDGVPIHRYCAALPGAPRDGSGPRAAYLREVCRLGVEICSALCALHARHLVHRDVSCGNILVGAGAGGAGCHATLMDLGIVAELPASHLWSSMRQTGKSEMFGTPGAM